MTLLSTYLDTVDIILCYLITFARSRRYSYSEPLLRYIYHHGDNDTSIARGILPRGIRCISRIYGVEGIFRICHAGPP